MSPADDQGNPITNFTGLGSNGTITVQSSTSVPEPASVTILAISGVIVQMGPGFLVGAASITSATETFGPGQRGGQDSSGYTHRLLRYRNTTRSGQNFASLSASISTPRPGRCGIVSWPSASRRNGSVVSSSMYTQGVRYST
jgi:hypothetical protein